MADFCLQCNREIFGINKSDLGGITSLEGQKEGKILFSFMRRMWTYSSGYFWCMYGILFEKSWDSEIENKGI